MNVLFKMTRKNGAAKTTFRCLCSIGAIVIINFLIKYLHGKSQIHHSVHGTRERVNMINQRTFSIREDIIKMDSAPELTEAMRTLAVTIIKDIVGPARKAFIFGLGDQENKGDAALGYGEHHFISSVGIEILYSCSLTCNKAGLVKASEIAGDYDPGEIIIFNNGGGNLGGYPWNDDHRIELLELFPRHKFVVLSQSVWFHTGDAHLQKVITAFSKHPDLHILLRDVTSYNFAVEHFRGANLYLAPDMAFGLGSINRYLPVPYYDFVHIQRGDIEKPDQQEISFSGNFTYIVEDWFIDPWFSPEGQDLLDNLILKTYTGLMFIQRGKVLITDRLHGHILAVLLDIPTAIIDNKIKKLSDFRNTWTSGLQKVVMATDAKDAAIKAEMLYNKYFDS